MLVSSSCRVWTRLSVIPCCFLLLTGHARAAAFAEAVVDYDPGVGYAVEFGTGLGYTLPEAALGSPRVETGFGGLTPFNPPFSREDLLSVGEGGHLTVRFESPLLNHTDTHHGLDFIVYGSAGFIDVDYPNNLTDGLGSIFSHNPGQTRVSVSADNVTYFRLDPGRAPLVDGYFPTDGQGQFGLPMDPRWESGDFAHLNLEQVRGLYAGSAGGTAFDLSWALDEGGEAVALNEVAYVRIDVLMGRSEIDAVAMVVPEPGTVALWGLALLGLGWRAARLCRKSGSDAAL